MKNLNVITSATASFGCNVAALCTDSDNKILFVLTDSLSLIKRHLNPSSNLDSTIILNEPLIDPQTLGIKHVSSSDILLMEYVVETGSIHLAFSNGHYLQCAVSSYSPPSALLYKHPAQLAAVKLSPQQDLLAIVDVHHHLHVMTIDGNITYSSNALNQNNSLHKPVGVGWGSKETQFFGLDGRPSAESAKKLQTTTATEQEIEVSTAIQASDTFKQIRSQQERPTVLDWRGDGQLLATLTYLDDNKHQIKVWNRLLELQYMSEKLITVERGLLLWIPNGHFVCCAQRRDHNVNELALLEKNGMIHDRISLPTMIKDLYIKEMTWSLDSKILALIVNQFTLEDQKVRCKPILMLYTMQNFHYYLKFSTFLTEDSQPLIRWDSIDLTRLHMIYSDGSYRQFDCAPVVNRSSRLSTVLVVDSNKCHLTPFDLCVMPPPMSAMTIEVENPIYKAFIAEGPDLPIVIITLDGKVVRSSIRNKGSSDELDKSQSSVIVHIHNAMTKDITERIRTNIEVSMVDYVEQYEQFWIHSSSSNIRAVRNISKKSQVVEFILGKDLKLTPQVLLEVSHKIVCVTHSMITRNRSSADFLFLLRDGSILVWQDAERATKTRGTTEAIRRNANCIARLSMINSFEGLDNTNLITESQDTISWNNHEISNSCTSFFVTNKYLMFTTANHLHLSGTYRNFGQQNKTVQWFTEPIELGSTIVIASDKNAKVVMQATRGSLETIRPRSMLFRRLTELVDEEKFLTAVLLARTHRMSTSFMVDYGIKHSLLKPLFDDVAREDVQLLNLLIADHDDTNEVKKRYEKFVEADSDWYKMIVDRRKRGSKVCTYAEILNNLSKEYLQPRLLCLMKMKPMRVDQALAIINGLGLEEKKDAFKFLLFFVDIEQLFNEALGTYRTSMASLVAEISHKDPKEYLPLLDRFDNLSEDELRQRFEIDMYLKRYDKALGHLLSMVEDYDYEDKDKIMQEVLTLITEKKLYKFASRRLLSHPNFAIVWYNYAQYLFQKRHYAEAGIAYLKYHYFDPDVQHLNNSIKCFLMADSHDLLLSALSKFPDDYSDLETVKRNLFDRFMERGQQEVALLLMTDGPIKCKIDIVRYIAKRQYPLAEYVYKRSVGDEFFSRFISKTLDYDHLSESNKFLRRLQDELKATYEYYDRLKELLIAKRDQEQSDINAQGNFDNDTISVVTESEFSICSSDRSIASEGSKSKTYSMKTRKVKRANAANKPKKISTKQGSKYEDLGLIAEIKKFITIQASNFTDMWELSAALANYSECFAHSMTLIEQLYNILDESMDLAKEMLTCFWPNEPLSDEKYSLYIRFNRVFNLSLGWRQQDDIELVLRPTLIENPIKFEM